MSGTRAGLKCLVHANISMYMYIHTYMYNRMGKESKAASGGQMECFIISEVRQYSWWRFC